MNKIIFLFIFSILFTFQFSQGQNISYKLYLVKIPIGFSIPSYQILLIKLYSNNMFILYRGGVAKGYATGTYEKKKRKIILHPYNSGNPTAYLEHGFIGKDFYDCELFKQNFVRKITIRENNLKLNKIKKTNKIKICNSYIPDHIIINDSIRIKYEFIPMTE